MFPDTREDAPLAKPPPCSTERYFLRGPTDNGKATYTREICIVQPAKWYQQTGQLRYLCANAEWCGTSASLSTTHRCTREAKRRIAGSF